MMVSEYFVDGSDEQELAATDFADFNANTTNQTQLVPTRDRVVVQEQETDPARLAATISDRWAPRNDGQDPRAGVDTPLTEPPFREMTIGPLPPGVDDTTPIAVAPYNPPGNPIGVEPLDDPALAAGHQISPERFGPGIDDLDNVVRIALPEEPVIRPQPRQVTHTVASGQTLSEIARKHYDGDANMWRSIRDANPGKVGPNGEVVEGAELVIPKRSAMATDPGVELSERAVGEATRPIKQRVRLIKVKEGETLSEIAYEYLGAGNKWPQIMAVNSDVLDKPEQLRAGMTLRIPAEEQARLVEEANQALAAGGERAPTREAAPGPRGRTYTVKSGDSLSLIANKQLGSTERYKDIFEANRDKLKSADDIRVGMVLVLPDR
ncbi:MAG: LysM peptidoglycan-binding domain-containing protein [Phycisphaeraceae bacterium]